MARVCEKCGAPIPWGAPQCVECRSYTHWRSRLATLGIAIGAGTVVVVIASMLWVWLVKPPAELRAAAEVQQFLADIAKSDAGRFVRGAGRCKPEVAVALCVQTTREFDSLDDRARRKAAAAIASAWRSVAEISPERVVFVGADGSINDSLGEK
jgi:hypothetical protein